MGKQSLCSSIINCLNSFQGSVSAKHVHSTKYPEHNIIYGEIIIQLCPGKSFPKRVASVQLHSSSNIDPDPRKGKVTQKVLLENRNIDKIISNDSEGKVIKYELHFKVEPDFGNSGALIIKNEHKHKFFLQSASIQIHHNQTINFKCNSWIYPSHLTKTDRIFFQNTCYLPNQTPGSLVEFRKEELKRLRGDGTEEKNEWDQIYDYDYYNDLGNPDKGQEYERPILGGSKMYPYPRRLKTGLPSSSHETRSPGGWFNIDFYVPPDECFSQKKMSEFMLNIIRAAMQFVIPETRSSKIEGKSNHFESFDQIHRLFTSNRGHEIEEWVVKLLKQKMPKDLFKRIEHVLRENTVKLPLPQKIAGSEFVWMDDEEFGRQMLAGTNPTGIMCLQAMNQWRIFILEHHDYLMPFLSRINTRGICAYASRTLLYLRNDYTLKPLAIELSLPSSSPHNEINRVFVPASTGTEAALWQLAKAHVVVTDSGFHQLINHWLKTHAVIEPYIISTRRNLSVMHPIHRLLDPHFKDTIQINAIARNMALNAGGILEKTLYTGHTSMELSSLLYKSWRFDEQSLPSDLIKRGMAIYNPNRPENVELLFEDYPYGADGLDIWMAIKNWVTDYVFHFYKDDDSLRCDYEIQEWWSEIRYVGHGDKCNEPWWYEMRTITDLVKALTTIIWIVSAHHAAISLGQYEYAGYPLYRPTLCREYIPIEGTMEFAEFLMDPDKYFLNMLPERFEMTLGIALVEVLSRNIHDESWLGHQPSTKWIDDERIHCRFKQFRDELQEVQKKIGVRNRDPKLKNRRGRANIPYEALCPGATASKDTMRRGIPNSINI
ncbi:hypothetical protein RD792_002959 [Penstemon davidsonii]|uniref:Lipoxygenase n=1 Tax=Penstemon davidsonii TaxID=160366 RepID=A0ABR0DSF4_9LAMI|nr:hypothetical protein RD792_002959 [Penstemon davidsonii]